MFNLEPIELPLLAHRGLYICLPGGAKLTGAQNEDY